MNGEGMNGLKSILADVYEKTGVEVRLRPLGGETEFSLEYCGGEVRAWIAGGASESEIKLVRYLVENAAGKKFLPEKSDYLKSILLGEGSSWYAFRFMTKYNLPDGPCFAVDILPDRRLDESVAHVERCLAESSDLAVKMDDSRLAVVKFQDEGQSPYDFCTFLAQSLYEELGVKASIGMGCETNSFSEIATSYNQAVTAVRMSGIFHSKGEVHSYREYLLVRMLEDVPEARLKDYMQQFRIENTQELFEDAEMIGTAEEFLENSLNVSETSRNLFMHRNTLMYRLDKIERLTGLNIRNFSDAVTFRVISILYRLLKL